MKLESTVEQILEPYRVLRTFSYGAAFFCMGLCIHIISPSLVQLEIYFSTTTQTIVWLFTSYSIGCLAGTAICGLVFDRLNPELQLGIGVALGGVFFALSSFIAGLYGMIVMMGLVGVCLGFVDSGGQSYCLCLWEGSRKKGPILQLIHVVWSVGASLGPLLSRLFLADLNHLPGGPTDNSSVCDPVTRSRREGEVFGGNLATEAPDRLTEDRLLALTAATPISLQGFTEGDEFNQQSADVGFVRYSYLVAGAFFVAPAILFAISFFLNGPSIRRNKATKAADPSEEDGVKDFLHSSLPQLQGNWSRKKTIFLLLMFPYLVVNIIVEVPSYFMAAYVVKELCWENQTGSLLMTVYRIGFVAGRLASIPLSVKLRPLTLLVGSMILRLLGFVLMACSVSFLPGLMWAAVSLLGLGCGNSFPTGLLYLSQYMLVTGRISASIVIVCSVTSILDPLVFGYVFDSPARNWIIYVPLIMTVIQSVSLFVMELYARKVGLVEREDTVSRVNGPQEKTQSGDL